MTNLERLLEKSRKEREALRNNFSPRVYEYHTNPEDEFKDEIIAIAVEALKDFELGHEHAPNLEHTRKMGDTYGWCDYCGAKVSWGPGHAEEALEKIETLAAKALEEK